MPARTITIAGLGDFRQLQTELERTGVIGDKSATTLVSSAKRAAAAAAEQAKLVGASADQQVAAAGRTAAAFVEAEAKMSRAQRAAATAGAEAAKAAGLSADQQIAAARRAGDAQKAAADQQIAAAKKTAEAHKATERAHTTVSKVGGVVALGVAGAAVEAVKLGMAYQTAGAAIQGATGQSAKSVGQLKGAFDTLGTGAQAAVGSGMQMEAAYAAVAGQLKLTEGHALSAAEATKFSAAANNLAEGAGIGIASAYAAVAKTMQTFRLSASQAGEVSDTLYSTSKALGVPVEQVAAGMGKLHARLGDVAPSLKDTAGLMTLVGEHGLTGGRGVMVVNTAFQTLLGGSKKTDDVLKALGVSVYDSNGKFIGMQSVISQLQPKLAGLTEHQRRFAEATLFGKGATEVMNQAIKGGVPAWEQATGAAQRHGSALNAAQKNQKTFKDEMEALKNTVKTLGGDLGVILIPKITAVAHALSEGIQWLEKHKAVAEALAGVITGVLGAAMTVFAYDKAAAFGKGIAGMVSGLKGLATNSAATAGAVGTADGVMVGETDAAAAAMKAALLTTGIGAALVLLGTAAFELEEHWGSVMKALESAAKTAADEIVKALNKIKQAAEIAAEGPLALRRLVPGLGGNVIPNIPTPFGPESGSGSHGAHPEGGPGLAAGRSVLSLQNLGLGTQVAQGIVKALQGETQKDLEKGAGEEGKEGAFGIAQWLGSRRAGLEAFAKSKKKPKSSLEVQLEYLAKELKGPEHGTLTALQHAHSTNEAAGIFIKQFERPEVPSTVEQRAAGYAPASSKALQEQIEEASGQKPKKKKGKAEPYVAPLAHPQITREDMGLDFAAHPGEQIKSIGQGIIKTIISNWYKGQPLIEEELTQGAHKHQDVYYAEQLKSKVTEGQHVAAGQSIATVAASGTGLEFGFGAGGGKTLAQATTGFKDKEGNDPTTASKAYAKFMESIGKSGSVLNAATVAHETATKAEAKRLITLEASAKKMRGETTPRGSLESAIQSGGVPQLEKILGVSTGGKAGEHLSRILGGYGGRELSQRSLEGTIMPTLAKSAEASGTGKAFDRLIAELKAVHTAATASMVSRLEQAHKQALANLGRELYAVTQERAAQALTNQATEEKDRTAQSANLASKELQVARDQATQVTDAMGAAATQISDATQIMKDSFAQMAEAVSLATKQMSDVASGKVQQTQDKTAEQVAILAERGKYGLDLIAQKLEVQLDQMKSQYDVQIQQAKMALDQAKISGQQLIAEKQQGVDLLQAHEDVLIATAQAHSDAVQVAQDQQEQVAQEQVDTAQITSDARADAAYMTSVLVAGGTKAQQDAAKGMQAWATASGQAMMVHAEAHYKEVEVGANAEIQGAQNALAQARGESAEAIENAKRALAKAEGESGVAIKNAEQGVAAIEGTAKVAESVLEGKIAIERERAQTQYAGSGLVVNQYGIGYDNAAANANEIAWALTHQLPV